MAALDARFRGHERDDGLCRHTMSQIAALIFAMAYIVPSFGGNLPRLRNLITPLTLGLTSVGDR
jgi:hypothetical protein